MTNSRVEDLTSEIKYEVLSKHFWTEFFIYFIIIIFLLYT
jgi:hypothetical protein